MTDMRLKNKITHHATLALDISKNMLKTITEGTDNPMSIVMQVAAAEIHMDNLTRLLNERANEMTLEEVRTVVESYSAMLVARVRLMPSDLS